MNRYQLLLFLVFAASCLMAGLPKETMMFFPVNTQIRLHVGDPVAGGAMISTWFGPVDFTGDSPWDGFTREYSDESEIRPPSDSPDTPADLHDKVLSLNTVGENLYYDPGTLAIQPATQVVAMRVRFIVTDLSLIGLESNPRYPQPPAGTGTALYLFQEDIEDMSGCFHLYTGKGGQPTWVAVSAEGLTPQHGEWHDIRFTLDSSGDATLVSCHVDGLLLSDETGATSFPLATGGGRKVVNALSFYGTGDVDSMSGCAVPAGEVFPTQESFSAQLTGAMAVAECPISVGDGTFAMEFTSPLAGTYTLQTAATPGGSFHDTKTARTVPAGIPIRLADPNATGDAAFYRVRFSR